MSTLPNTLHETIDAAIADVYTVLSQPDKYALKMSVWAQPPVDGVCHVCVAGAFISQRLVDVHKPRSETLWGLFTPSTAAKLYAINSFRMGFFANSLEEFYGPSSELEERGSGVLSGMEDVFAGIPNLKTAYRDFLCLDKAKALCGSPSRADVDSFLSQEAVIKFRAKLKEFNL